MGRERVMDQMERTGRLQLDIVNTSVELLVQSLRDRPDGIVRTAKTLGAFWTYDYKATEAGQAGLHAELKSGLHSDGYFDSKILLKPYNVRRAIAQLMIEKLQEKTHRTPDCVAGVPNGATELGQLIAEILGAKSVQLEKIEGQIKLHSQIRGESSMLLIEDLCTRGTGFTEAVREIKLQQPTVQLAPFNPVIINRGDLEEIVVPKIDNFRILPLVEMRINDWNPEECPLCQMGSEAIKPKDTDENWQRLTTPQPS